MGGKPRNRKDIGSGPGIGWMDKLYSTQTANLFGVIARREDEDPAESFPWIYVPPSVMAEWYMRGKDRERNKLYTYKSDEHPWGYAGEQIYQIATGIKVDSDLHRGGDGGCDTAHGVDIKTVVNCWKRPHLKHEIDLPMRARAYALVVLNPSQFRGAYLGTVEASVLREAPITQHQKFNYTIPFLTNFEKEDAY